MFHHFLSNLSSANCFNLKFPLDPWARSRYSARFVYCCSKPNKAIPSQYDPQLHVQLHVVTSSNLSSAIFQQDLTSPTSVGEAACNFAMKESCSRPTVTGAMPAKMAVMSAIFCKHSIGASFLMTYRRSWGVRNTWLRGSRDIGYQLIPGLHRLRHKAFHPVRIIRLYIRIVNHSKVPNQSMSKYQVTQ